MANPQCENGYIRIASEIVDALARINLSAYEYRILWGLWRKTYGYGKTEDKISITQFEKYTGMKRRHVSRTLDSLVSKNIVIKKGEGYISIYGFNKNFESWGAPSITYSGDSLKDETITLSGDSLKDTGITYSGDTLSPNEVTKLSPNEVTTIDNIKLTIDIPTFSKTKKVGGKKKTFSQDAEDILSSYPKIHARDTTLRSILRLFKNGETKEVLLSAVSNYTAHIESENTERKYIIQSNNFFGQQARYKDYLTPPPAKIKQSAIARAIERCKARGDY